MQLENAKDWPEPYTCRFLEAGIVSYEDSDAGIALLKKETIDKMAPTFIGRPVIIDHQNITPANFEKAAVGYVINVRFNPEDAWFYADFIITDDKARVLIDEKGYSVSCAYNVIDVSEGGLWHDIKFDGEIIDGSFTHLALVESPRYEDSKITKQLPAMLVNGKAAHYFNNQKETKMSIFKLFKKKENDKDQDIGSLHMEIDQKAVPVTDILLYCLNGKKLKFESYAAANEKQQYMVKDEDIVDMNGNSISIGELKAAYMMKTENEKKNCSCGATGDMKHKDDCTFNKKNAAAEEEEKKKKDEEAKNAKAAEEKAKAEEEAKAKENAKKAEEEAKAKELQNAKDAEEKAKKEAEEKLNSKNRLDAFFTELGNAGKQFDNPDDTGAPAPRTRAERAKAFREKTGARV